MNLKKLFGNVFGSAKEEPTPAAEAPIKAINPQGYLAMRQKAIDIRAGKRGVRLAQQAVAARLRLAKLYEWAREGNEVRRFTREIQLEQWVARETARLDQNFGVRLQPIKLSVDCPLTLTPPPPIGGI
jgi:hypothetical protein